MHTAVTIHCRAACTPHHVLSARSRLALPPQLCEAHTSAESLLDSSALELASFALLVRTHGVRVSVHSAAESPRRALPVGAELAQRLRDSWPFVQQPLASAWKATAAGGGGSPPELEQLCEVLNALGDQVLTRFADEWAARVAAAAAPAQRLSDQFR